ncbi:hypothetical protein [Saccharothrix texasensis]|uniref:Uncharacterized protein n=1 Tax=Saccharothrix texasensis TaxID=103734 RepID=A0A3N1H8Z8_9PSEU|nr:hypothetical protein [Saccharothrix texasensis]ROP38990.1 hypothetical protein EDD40_4358 [Saccharothrix texasensis]
MADSQDRSSEDSELVKDLKWLRKGPGLTLARLSKAGAVVQACGGPQQPTETTCERFLSALRSMNDFPGGRALWAAYGADGGDQQTELKERRAAYAKSVKRTAGRVRDWEDEAIDELALRLLSAFYAGAPDPKDFPIPRGGYLMTQLSVVCINKDRRFMESRQTRTVIPLVDGAPHFRYGTYTPTELSDAEGGILAPSVRGADGGVVHTIEFPVPLRRGRAHTFSFRERVPDSDPEPAVNVDFSGQSFESPALRYRVEVHFLTDRPKFLWGYDKLHRIERPGAPESGIPLTLDDEGRISVEFADLYGGLCAGVAWQWE